MSESTPSTSGRIRAIAKRPIAWALAFCVTTAAWACGAAPHAPDGAGAAQVRGGGESHLGKGITGDTAPTDYFPCSEDTLEACWEVESATSDLIQDVRHFRRADDAKDVPAALSMLSFPDARVKVELVSFLAAHATAEGVEAALLPLIADPHPALQAAAAEGLSHGSDDGRRLADQWQLGHSTYEIAARDRDPPRDPARWGFPVYPHAAPYPPADAWMSMGLSTHDSIDAIARTLARELRTEPVAVDVIAGALNDMMTDVSNAAQADAARSGAEVLETWQQRMPIAAPLPSLEAMGNGKAFVVRDDQGIPTRIALVYVEPALKLAIIQYIWNARAFPELPHIAVPIVADPFAP